VHPETRYAKSGEVNVAYQVVGDGPRDLVLVSGFVSHLEHDWYEGRSAHFLGRLTSFARLIRFDKRGTGLSDRPGGLPDLETRMDDVRAVMDAVGSERAALFGYSEGGPMACLFAATYPERSSGLVLYGTYARRADPDGDYPWCETMEERRAVAAEIERSWGTEADLATWRSDARSRRRSSGAGAPRQTSRR
jgi:pimeloyl-ACP methyl ester carboxylesterase